MFNDKGRRRYGRRGGSGRPSEQGYTERSKKMINQEMVHQDLESVGSVEGRFASPADSGRGFSLLLAAQEEEEARAALARAQEYAAIEAQDVLSQADEALVMG
jgi:hypothetical protein